MRGKRWALLGVVLLSGLALATAQAYGQEEVDQLEELFAPKPPYAEPEVPEPTLQPGLLPPPPPLPEAAPEPFIAAYNLYREGRLQEAYGAFNAYLQEFPAVPTTDDAVYYLGEISYRQGQYAEALRLYQYLLDKFLASDRYLAAKVRVGLCFYQLGFYERAVEVLEPLLSQLAEPNEKWAARQALAASSSRRGERLKAAAVWVSAHEDALTETQRLSARQGVKALLAKMTNRELLQLSDRYPSAFPGPSTRFRLGLNYFNAKRFKEARETLLGFLADNPGHREANRARVLISSIDQSFVVDISKLGLILPLTGEGSIAGESVLQGVQLAVAQAGVSPEGRPFKLSIKDSAGEPSRARAAVVRLALEDKVVAVVGPVFSETARAAAAEADRLRLPMLVPFAHAQGIPEASPYVFRNSLTNQAQGAYLARYAVESLGLKRFAVLYPDDTYGNDLKNILAENIEAIGGEVLMQVPYDPQANDFSEPIRTLGGIADEELEQFQPNHEEGPALISPLPMAETAPPIDYDALFIPGYFNKVGLLAPQLAFYNVTGVTLLGANGWNSPELLTIGEHYVEGAIFVDGFFADSPNPEVKAFVENFRLTFGQEPDILAAQAYDATSLILKVLKEGASSREQLKEGLLTVQGYPGASGFTSITETGEAQKNLFLLMVRRGKIVQIN
jgi:ABC-type branched-subunit amino acid transport system substrate-binding protein